MKLLTKEGCSIIVVEAVCAHFVRSDMHAEVSP